MTIWLRIRQTRGWRLEVLSTAHRLPLLARKRDCVDTVVFGLRQRGVQTVARPDGGSVSSITNGSLVGAPGVLVSDTRNT